MSANTGVTRHDLSNTARHGPAIHSSSIEIIDLSTDSEDETIPEQTASADPVQRQSEPEDPRLSFLKCVICLDTPTDLTATTCGHLFCHECITAALRVTSSASGNCPSCRRKVTIKSLIPLSILKGPVLGSDVQTTVNTQPLSASRVDQTKSTTPKATRRASTRNKPVEI